MSALQEISGRDSQAQYSGFMENIQVRIVRISHTGEVRGKPEMTQRENGAGILL